MTETPPLATYLQQKGYNFGGNEEVEALAVKQLKEKDKIISNMEGQITKYKCEQIKNQKLIKQLQDKITQLSPSCGDTGSNFMMASQFKTKFQEFMTSAVPLALSGVIDRPFLFSKCLGDVFSLTYSSLEEELSEIVANIRKAMRISQIPIDSAAVIDNEIKMALIKVFQEHWQTIFPFNEPFPLQYAKQQETAELTEQLNQLVMNEDYLQMRKQLHQITVYMHLQDKPWEFVNIDCRRTEKYQKKQHICLDGWVKDGEEALLVLQGLKKGNHLHPNLKNYVVPYDEDDHPDLYSNLSLTFKVPPQEQTLSKTEQQQLPITKQDDKLSVQQQEEEVSLSDRFEISNIPTNTIQLKSQESLISKNKSAQFIKEHKYLKESKQNNPHAMNKRPKKKDRTKGSLETSLKVEKSPKNKRKHDQSLRTKKIQSEQHLYIEEKIQVLKQELFCKKKNSTAIITKNVSNDLIFEDFSMFPVKRRPLDEMPLRKKTKPATSRKNSVGKIVSQHHIINPKDVKQKENCSGQANVKVKNKQKTYKDIIKEKLMDEKMHQKEPLTLLIPHPKSKTERDKKKEENRPLKIQGNVSKLREKYMS